MFNPFPVYHPKYLPLFIQKGVKCFVKQTYERGRNLLEEKILPAYLLTQYHDIGLAKEHMDSIRHDAAAVMLVVSDADDLKELQRLGRADCAERIYLRFRDRDAEERARKKLDKKLRAYIDHKLGWRIAGYDSVSFSLDFHFGEIYVVLKHGSRYQKVNIDDIESLKEHVL
jgi:hypothetical protein